ncbi:MAG: glycosyltransferase family 4 protein [Lachnospiraceae bacterium]|nr:glycosyltransferase family 4 protein [Lachnospiraceae bacterium]
MAKGISVKEKMNKSGTLTVAVDLTALGERMSGLERYAYRITEALIHTTRKVRFILVVRNEVPDFLADWRRFSRVSFCVIKGNNKLLVNQLRLPAVMKKLNADRYLFPAFPVPLRFRMPNTYGLIADLACFHCPETMKRSSVVFFRKGYAHTVKTCNKVITISQESRNNILFRYVYFRHWIEKEDVILAPCAPDQKAKRPANEVIDAVRAKYALPEKYWLCLCTMEPRKNLPMLLQAYRELRQAGELLPPLVLAGREGWKNKELHEEIRRFEAEDTGSAEDIVYLKSLHVLGALPEADLPALYAGAECFLFPSKYEGFGLPPLEAQSYGVRKVVVSDIPVLREVMGSTAFYFENTPAALKKALLQARVWQGCGENKIRRNLARFSWRRSAEEIWEAMMKDED